MSSEYKSKKVTLSAPIDVVYSRFSNLENLKKLIEQVPEDKIPADKLEQFNKMEMTPDSITIQGGPTGTITLQVIERREPNLVTLSPVGLPLTLDMHLHFMPVSDDVTEAEAVIEADIPMMLRPMVKGPLQKIVDEFATMMASVPFQAPEK